MDHTNVCVLATALCAGQIAIRMTFAVHAPLVSFVGAVAAGRGEARSGGIA